MRFKLRTKKSSDWSNANSLILFAHPLHAAYYRCLLPTASLLETSWEVSNLPLLLNLPT